MKLKYIFSLLAVLLVFSSCEKFLETKPSDFLNPSDYYNSEKELEYALAGVYDVLGSSRLYGALCTADITWKQTRAFTTLHR